MPASAIGAMSPDQISNFVKRRASLILEKIDQTMITKPSVGRYFPVNTSLTSERVEFYVTHGNPGVPHTTLSGTVERVRDKQLKKVQDIKWHHYGTFVPDEYKTKVRIDDSMADAARYAQNFFNYIQDFDIITELKASNNTNTTDAATDYWTDDTGRNIDKDIANALQTILEYSNVQNINDRKWICIYPGKAVGGLMELDTVNGNVVRRMEDYLKEAWKGGIEFVPFSPTKDADGNEYLDNWNTSSDALGTSAIICATGPDVLKNVEWRPPEINRAETWRTHGEGENVLYKKCTGAVIVPQYDSNMETTPLVFELTGVVES